MTEQVVSFQEYLESTGTLTYTNRGVSMLPMLRQGKDLITIEKRGKGRLQKYDVILFDRENGDHVLHRVVKVLTNGYSVLGDNCYQMETVREDQIYGVLKSFVRNGRTVSVTDPSYRIYSRLIVFLYPMRKLFRRAGNLIRRLLNRWKRQKEI